MMPEDPECPYPLKLMAIRELEEQIARIVKSLDWDSPFDPQRDQHSKAPEIREEERRGTECPE